MRQLREACGVFGLFNHPDAAAVTALGLQALQHRGQESAGLVAGDAKGLRRHVGMGLVTRVFGPAQVAALPGSNAIGHVRYSTTGASTIDNAQPFLAAHAGGMLALAHNGNIVNGPVLRQAILQQGATLMSSSDSEVLLRLILDHPSPNPEAQIAGMMAQAEGAYSLVLLSEQALTAVRDPRGFKPLVLGRLGNATVVTSETAALDLVGAVYEREIAPGEILRIDATSQRSIIPLPPVAAARCIFEHIYFARPDSIVFGRQVHGVRKELGRQLAREQPVQDADVVVPIPDSGVSAAIGYAEQLGVPFDMGLVRSHYAGRTFTDPDPSRRHLRVEMKFQPVAEAFTNRRVVLVDDSIVRGTTAHRIVEMVRSLHPREVHLRLSSPPARWPCFYGIDTPTAAELLASRHPSPEAIAREIAADSLAYLSRDGMHRVVAGLDGKGYCDACFSGHYPL